MAIIKRMLAEKLAKLLRNNVWKLHKLLEYIISDRRSQLVMKLIKS